MLLSRAVAAIGLNGRAPRGCRVDIDRRRFHMTDFRVPVAAPWSGDVSQWIAPVAAFMPSAGQFGLINISLGQSSAPVVERDVLAEVGSYGRQLGKIADVLAVLVARLPREALSEGERDAVEEFVWMRRQIDRIKRRHGRDVAGA
jgi:hypothetical protein